MLDETVRTGIDLIDADHARLVSLLEKIDLACARGQRRTVARLLGRFIETFDRHFESERRVLADLRVPDLERRHSEFITARSWVMSHPIDPSDVEQVDRIVEYARAWLTDHVVRQDGAIAEELRRRSAQDRLRRGFRLDAVPLRWRMAVMGLVPLLIVVGLAWLSLSTLIDSLHSAAVLRAVTEVDARIGDLVFELQEESNRAIMVVGSPRRDREALKEQIARSDVAIENYRKAIGALRPEVHEKGVVDALDNADASLALIWRSRSDVGNGTYDVYSTIEYYGTAVADLMAIVPVVTRRLEPSEVGTRIGSYVFLLSLRERAGAERALGTSLLSGVTVDILSHDPKFIAQFATEQDSLGRTFTTLADGRFAEALSTASSVSPMLAWMRRAIGGEERGSLTARDWSDTTGLRIERMRTVERKLVAEIEAQVGDLSAQAWRHALFLGGGIVAAIALSLSLTALLGWSILPPLSRLGLAIRRLADGDRLVMLPDGDGRDEIADLARNFVDLRNRLIQGDLLEAQRGTENADRLRTTLDGLPGIVFRVALTDGAAARVVAASSKLHQLTGLRDQDVLDRSLRSVLRVLLEPEDRVSLLHVLRRVGLSSLDFECRLRRIGDGRQRWVRILATPVQTEHGCLWDGVALDVTLAKQAELERRRLQEELDRLHRSQMTTRLAAGLGNDLARIGEPLRRTADDLLADLPADSPLADRLREIRAMAVKTERLATQLTRRNGDGHGAVPVTVIDRLERGLEAMRRDLPAGLTLETRFDLRDAAVLCEPEAIDHLVDNLAGYLNETLGHEPGVISITAGLAAGEFGGSRHLRIAIRDDRSALAPRALAKVLRLRTSRLAAFRGEELSLAIVRMVVDGAHGWIQSGTSPRGGSLLEIFLPLHEERRNNIIRFRGSAR